MIATRIALAVCVPLVARADTAIRIGVARDASDSTPATANGVFADGEIAWRYAPSGSVGVFGAVSTTAASGTVQCTLGAVPVDMTEQYSAYPIHVDVGVRSTWHDSSGLFLGMGVGLDVSGALESTSGGACFAPPSTGIAPMIEFHAGITLPDLALCSACAVQIFVAATGVPALQSDALGESSLRLALGIQFH